MGSKEKFMRLITGVCLLVAILCRVGIVYGQEYDSIALKYKNEHAVITNYTQRMVISFEDGKPVGKSYITKEKLLISDVAPGNHYSDGFWHSSTFHEMEDFMAWTYTPEKGGYKKTPVYTFGDAHEPSRSSFYDDSWVRYVAFSGLSKMSRTKVKYTLAHTDGHMLMSFFPQQELPVVKATFEVVAPKTVEMNFALKGENTSWIKQSKKEADGMITYTFTAEDIPAYKEYAGVPDFRYYMPHVIPIIASYKRYSEDKRNEWLTNPEELYKHYYTFISNINMVEDTALKRIVKDVTKNDRTDREKAAHIYRWVQKNLHYIAFENGLEGFVPREARLVCNRKYGDCKDMASILVAMYRLAGLNAYYTWIGTTDLPYTYEETPWPGADNHMICALKLGEDWVFVDGTHDILPFGANREDIQGKEALIAIDKKTFKIITVPEEPASKNEIVDSTFITSFADGKIDGNIKARYTGYPAWRLRSYMKDIQIKDREKLIRLLIERGTNKFTLNRYEVDRSDTINKTSGLNASFSAEDYVTNVGKQYYVNMNLQREFGSTYIDTKDRTVSYYFDYKRKVKQVVVLNIPKGYRVTYVPKNAHGAVNDLWSYTITYKTDKNKITLVKEYELNTLAVTKKQFADHNKMVQAVKKQYGESVVLTANK